MKFFVRCLMSEFRDKLSVDATGGTLNKSGPYFLIIGFFISCFQEVFIKTSEVERLLQ